MTDATVAFIDLAGFVALTDAHGAIAAADLADRFINLATTTVTEPARVVKAIGDAVMLSAPTPEAGLAATVALIRACLAEPAFPIARGGIDHGPVEHRGGDMYGPAVNIAARLTGYAAGPQLLLTAALLPAAEATGLALLPLGEIRLRNLARPVTTYALALDADNTAVIDPVCRMQLNPSAAAGRLRHDALEYFFCSRKCLAAFATDPDSYVNAV